jgi:heptosyltransferase II
LIPKPLAQDSRILVVGPSWVGDMVMAQSLFITLRRLHPERPIDVLAPAWSRPLLERMPEVDAALDMPLGHGRLALGERRRIGRALAERGYGQAILLPNSFKSALVPFWANIPRRTGWVGELRYGLLNDIRPLDKRRYSMTVQRFVALAHPAGYGGPLDCPPPRLRHDPANVQAARQALGLMADPAPLALCPGAEYGPAKRWPETHYAELARGWLAEGGAVWLFGSDKDRPVCQEINRLAGDRCRDLSGRTSLGQAIDLLGEAAAVVSNDSGLMHVAAALGRPLVALYGSSDPAFTPPLSEDSRVLTLGLACSPCFKRRCPLGHTRCLTELGVERVVEAITEPRPEIGPATHN